MKTTHENRKALNETNESNNDLKNAVLELVAEVSSNPEKINDKWLDAFVRTKNRETHDATRKIAKRRLMPEYLRLKREEPETLKRALASSMAHTEKNESVNQDSASPLPTELDVKLTELLRAKPRRTASGVATITVLTKPWPCSGDCVFCPNDIRMPKSYIHNEPACQRAERWNFDPYMQVSSRLAALFDMGHNVDKIELIILGGTFTDYPKDYQTWFVKECFRACNDFKQEEIEHIKAMHRNPTADINDNEGMPSVETLEKLQNDLDASLTTYNNAWEIAYGKLSKEQAVDQSCPLDKLFEEHRINEEAHCRIVGLVVETRPDSANHDSLVHLRKLGCTKIQIGIQTLDEEVLKTNCRNISLDQIKEALSNLRILGFKSHVHIMPNLMGSTPEKDVEVYKKLVSEFDYMPDEVKLYPCCLVKSARLTKNFEDKSWKPYTDEELLEVIISCLNLTPPQTRISRMIRDISTTDIIAGNKKPNLRQMVEEKIRSGNNANDIQEIRFREIAIDEVNEDELLLNDVEYKTNNTLEHFLQWITPKNRLVGFLRLSLPKEKKEAMIREVHVYGKVAKIHSRTGSQHIGLGSKLVTRACEIAKSCDYKRINVISSVGTRQYYRSLGFEDEELYQFKKL